MSVALCFVVASYLASVVVCAPTHTSRPSLPIVELPYERHQAIAFNETAKYYTFSNIRYAQPPVGDLRFRAPQPPKVNKSTIQNGSFTATCPQGLPVWQANILDVVGEYIGGKPYTEAAFEADVANASFPAPNVNNGTSEDCLFLDVYAPEKVFNNSTKPAPVLVWIHGGGFVIGSKTGTGSDFYDPAGLISASSDDLVFVALNYRLGALGWLAGPTLQTDGTANAGLYDQRLALNWIQENIHLFGGDKDRVTVMGESAGGSSIMLQITAFGGLSGPAPFAQAITQSPAFFPEAGSIQPEQNLQTFLKLLNVSSIDEARQLPSSTIIAANAQQVHNSPNSTYTYGPVSDGSIIPAVPGRLLQDGHFDLNVNVLIGHNIGEGVFFADPFVATNSAFNTWLSGMLPNLPPSAETYITSTLYPPIFDGSQGYTNQYERQATLFADLVVDCNTLYLAHAFANKSYAYEFSVPPGLHTQDLKFTFAFGAKTQAPLNATVATALQGYISSFVTDGKPTAAGFPSIPFYGGEGTLMNLTNTGIATAKDNLNVERCAWWQQGLLN